MVSTNKILTYTGIAVLVYFLFKGGKKLLTASNIEFIIKNINVAKPSITITLFNPGSETINIQNILLNVSIQNSRIGIIRNNQLFTIPAQNNVDLELKFDFDMIGASQLITQLFYRTKEYVFDISGTITADNIQFPVSKNYTLNPNVTG